MATTITAKQAWKKRYDTDPHFRAAVRTKMEPQDITPLEGIEIRDKAALEAIAKLKALMERDAEELMTPPPAR